MVRGRILPPALVLLATALLSVFGLGTAHAKDAAADLTTVNSDPAGAEKPNILFIVIDDLRPEIGAYGVERAKTPNMDRLAANGVMFSRAYVQQAVCGPSRASFLTGMRPDSIGITDNRTRFREQKPDVVTLPQYFRENGYFTAGFGKIFHGEDETFYDRLSWSVMPYAPPATTNGNLRGYLSDENLVLLAKLNESSPTRKYHASYWEAMDVPDRAYPDGQTVEKAADYFWKLGDQPFFMAVGIERPHLPFTCPKKYWDMYDRETFILPGTYAQKEPATSFTSSQWGDFRHYPDVPAPEDFTEDEAKRAAHGYLACVSYADALVGQLLAALKESGREKNTMIVVIGDHGWKLGEHFMFSKSTNYELDARAPVIFAWPEGLPQGEVRDDIVEFIDLYPTMADLAGLPSSSPQLEGDVLSAVLREGTGGAESGRDGWAISQYPRFDRDGPVMGYTFRNERYRSIMWLREKTGEVLAREVYDHAADPDEAMNLARGTTHARTIAALDRAFAAAYETGHGRKVEIVADSGQPASFIKIEGAGPQE